MENSKRFIEYVETNISNRNQIIPIELYHSAIKNTAFVDKESYGSYYRFDSSYYDYVTQHSSVKGYEGLVYVDRLILDIDKHSFDNDTLYETVKAYIGQCLEFGLKKEDINLWYSGNGFHIELMNAFGFQPAKNIHEKVKQTLIKHFNFADSIYDKTRIIRSNWSFNQKTEAYKIYIPLKYLEDISMEDIMSGAKGKEEYKFFTEEYNEWFNELNEPGKEIEPYLQTNVIDAPTIIKRAINKTSETNSVVTCMQHVFNEGAIEGSRHQKILRLASSYKRSGLPFLAAVASILEWNGTSMNADNVVRIVQNVYEGNYQYGCNDVIMSEYCDSKCIYYKNKNYTLDIKDIDELEDSFRDYIQKDFSKKSIDMKEIWDVPSYCFRPGELIIFSGDTGMGKTAFVQNIVAKTKLDTLFLSLEMNEHLTFRRFIQVVAGKTKEWVVNSYLSNDNTSFRESMGHIKIMTVQPEIEAVKKIVAEQEPSVLVVDTTDELQVDGYKNDIQEQNMKINALKSMAQKHNLIIFAIHHINKSSATSGQLGIHSLKGSSNVVQKADKVILIRGANRDDKYRMIQSVKSRDENAFEMMAKFNYETMTYEKVDI